MDALNTFIGNANKATGVPEAECDIIIQEIVKAVNNGVLGGSTNQMSHLAKIKKQKFTTANRITDAVMPNVEFERDNVKKVSTWMVEMMIQTLNKGGMPALMRMVNLMKKGKKLCPWLKNIP